MTADQNQCMTAEYTCKHSDAFDKVNPLTASDAFMCYFNVLVLRWSLLHLSENCIDQSTCEGTIWELEGVSLFNI